jgi:serine/threonine protein phosphatase PrpC
MNMLRGSLHATIFRRLHVQTNWFFNVQTAGFSYGTLRLSRFPKDQCRFMAELPVTEKVTHTGVTAAGLAYGVSSMQGWRAKMEDTHITDVSLCAYEKQADGGKVINLPDHSLFAVFDGHCGLHAAAYAERNLCRVLSQQQTFVEYAKLQQERLTEEPRKDDERNSLALLQQAFTESFVAIDKEFYCAVQNQAAPDANKSYQQWLSEIQGGVVDSSPPILPGIKDVHVKCGTTACVVLLTPDWIVCANAGDSRSVLSCRTADSEKNAIDLSFDHKPNKPAEKQRILAAGGYVEGGRLDGDASVSRCFGDFDLKIPEVVLEGDGRVGQQKVSPIPDVIVRPRDAQKDAFIIIACDGIWDVLSNEGVVEKVSALTKEGTTDLGRICEEVCVLMLVVIVFFIVLFFGYLEVSFLSI